MQIILKLTTACNLKCVYCSEGEREIENLEKEVFYKLVDELPELLKHVDDCTAEFLFHGGEPLLYGRENILTLINYARENLKNYKTKFLMQTNGTLIDDDWIRFFDDEQIEIGVSIDGYQEIHDENRRTKNNEPTLKKILENLKKLREAKINFGTLMVLNSAEKIDDEKLFKFIRENDLQIKIHSVTACGRAAERKDTKKIYAAYVELMKKILKRALEDDATKIIEPLDEILNAILGINPIRECSYNGTCGKNFISIYPDGEVGFCGRDNFSRNFIYGNLNNEKLIDLYNSENARKIRDRQKYLKENDCKNCDEWELCHGGCSFEAVNAFDSLNAKYENCVERKNFIKWLRTEGLKILKAALIREKIKYRESLKIKRKIFNEIDNFEVH